MLYNVNTLRQKGLGALDTSTHCQEQWRNEHSEIISTLSACHVDPMAKIQTFFYTK